jgi:hypothetical protein
MYEERNQGPKYVWSLPGIINQILIQEAIKLMIEDNQDKESENSKELCDSIEYENENRSKLRREALAKLEKSEELYTVATRLTKHQADYVQDTLLEDGIYSRVEIEGAPRSPVFTFRIDVYRNQIERVTGILERIEEEKGRNRKLATPVCPSCKLSVYTEVQELNLFEKMLYVGCKVYKCSNCGKKWGQ